MKRSFLALLTAALLVLALCLPAAAAEPTSLLVLGDSISTGYGLTSEGGARIPSYGNQLAAAYGLDDAHYRNLAVNGATSADLLAQLPEIAEHVKAADIIVISIGGNDVLGKMLNLLQQATATTSLDAALEALETADMSMVGQAFETDTVREEYLVAIRQYGRNLNRIVSQLEKQNPAARVIFLTQYDPLNGADQFIPEDENKAPTALLNFTDDIIGKLNAEMKKAVEGHPSFSLCDIHAAFADKGGALTRIYEADIHPNPDGHAAIFAELKKTIDALPVPETTVAPETTTAPETTVVPDTTRPPETTAAPTTITPPTTLEPLPLDDNRNTVPVLVILGIALLCIGFGLIRMITAKK